MAKFSVILLDSKDHSSAAKALLAQRLVDTFSLPAAEAKQLLGTLPAIFSQSLDVDDAKACLAKLEQLGAVGEIIPYDAATGELELDLSASSPAATAASPNNQAGALAELDLGELQAMLDNELSLDTPGSNPAVAPQSSAAAQAVGAPAAAGGLELDFSFAAESPSNDLSNDLSSDSQDDLFSTPVVDLNAIDDEAALADLFEPRAPALDSAADVPPPPESEMEQSVTNDPLEVLQGFAQDDPQEFGLGFEAPSPSLAPEPPPLAAEEPQTEDTAPAAEGETAAEEQPSERGELVEPENAEEILLRAFARPAQREAEHSGEEDGEWVDEDIPNSGRGSKIILGIGVAAMVIVAGVVGPKALRDPELDQGASGMTPPEVFQLLRSQKDILGIGRASKKKAVEVRRNWVGEFEQGPLKVKIDATTLNGALESASLSMSAEQPEPLTDEEIFNGVSRPWLANFESSRLAGNQPADAPAEVSASSQAVELKGSGRAYLEDRTEKRRAVAEVTLSAGIVVGDSLTGSWSVASAKLPAECADNSYLLTRLDSGQYSICAGGTFRLTPAPEQENDSDQPAASAKKGPPTNGKDRRKEE